MPRAIGKKKRDENIDFETLIYTVVVDGLGGSMKAPFVYKAQGESSKQSQTLTQYSLGTH